MAIVFDPINKHIKITSGTEITALEIYNAAMDWCDEQENMAYLVPMKAVGKFPMGAGVDSDSIFILINGWKLKLYDGNYQFTFKGTIITDDESVRTVPPDSGNIEMVFQVASQATIIGDIEDLNQKCDTLDAKTDAINDHVQEINDSVEGKWEIVTEGGIDYLIQYKINGEIFKKFRLVKENNVYIARIPV